MRLHYLLLPISSCGPATIDRNMKIQARRLRLMLARRSRPADRTNEAAGREIDRSMRGACCITVAAGRVTCRPAATTAAAQVRSPFYALFDAAALVVDRQPAGRPAGR